MLVATGAILILSMALYHPAAKVLSRIEYSGTAMNSMQPTYLKILLFVGSIFYILQLLSNVIRWVQRTEGDVTGGH